MILLGTAKLVEGPHPSGVTIKQYDLSPWGGPLVPLGAATSPLPPAGSTRDFGQLRIDLGTGETWKLEGKEPPPTLPQTEQSMVSTARLLGGVNLHPLAIVGAVFMGLSMLGLKFKRRSR